ncbi:MAG: GFA family protein, partial [Candidatus Hydrogenedentes bacterium]|nr:GFA family protein [Candidatus Hydrogenedentota bacterium]
MPDASHPISCACGQVSLTINAELSGPFQCYCRQCRHASGGGPATFVMVPRDGVRIEGAVASYSEPTESGN